MKPEAERLSTVRLLFWITVVWHLWGDPGGWGLVAALLLGSLATSFVLQLWDWSSRGDTERLPILFLSRNAKPPFDRLARGSDWMAFYGALFGLIAATTFALKAFRLEGGLAFLISLIAAVPVVAISLAIFGGRQRNLGAGDRSKLERDLVMLPLYLIALWFAFQCLPF